MILVRSFAFFRLQPTARKSLCGSILRNFEIFCTYNSSLNKMQWLLLYVSMIYANLLKRKKAFARKEFNSHRIVLVHQHGCRFIVLEHRILPPRRQYIRYWTVQTLENWSSVVSVFWSTQLIATQKIQTIFAIPHLFVA